MYGGGSGKSYEEWGLDLNLFGTCSALEGAGGTSDENTASGASAQNPSGGGRSNPGNLTHTSTSNLACGPSTSGSGDSRYPGEVSKVGVKMPPFWRDDPEVWFCQVECQFALAGITSDITKFNTIVGQLDSDYAVLVKDLIKNPPATGKYAKLRQEIIRRLSFSPEKKTLQLIQHEELGDRKPSQFLLHLQSLAGPDVPSDFIRTIWTSRLPTNVQAIVASQPKMGIEDLAELADRVHDIVQPGMSVASTSRAPVYAPPNAGMSLEGKIAQLTVMVEALYRQQNEYQSNHQGRRPDRSNSNNRQRSRSRSRSRQRPENHPHCWYHYTFGNKANKCSQPCTFNQSGKQEGSY